MKICSKCLRPIYKVEEVNIYGFPKFKRTIGLVGQGCLCDNPIELKLPKLWFTCTQF